ncbi:MAG: fused MFS/spermidine synthase [Verrucomicrobia bacterium]|nr:fused MFS/spermidine synthase [Verrucomicrobiota bacterium]
MEKRSNERADSQAAAELSPALRRYLYVTVLAAGAAVMIVEILGAKLLAPYFGSSHFVWTAQIAVTLLALAAGYAVGGGLADASRHPDPLFAVLLGAAFWLALDALICEPVAFACLKLRLAMGSLLAALILFFLPLASMATVGPFVVKLITTRLKGVGANVGKITALGTLGSVGGTLLIGYALLPRMSNTAVLLLTAAALAAMGLGYFVAWRPARIGPGAATVLTGGLLGFLAAHHPPLRPPEGFVERFRRNSNFGLIQVIDTTDGRLRYYLNDLLTQNSWDPKSRRSMSMFTYMLHELARIHCPNLRRALCVGLGVGIVPGRLAAEGVQVDVVEINPAIVPVAEKYFGFDPSRVRLHFGDGRYYLATSKESYDAIILDAFLGESPPAHLMTREAFEEMRRLLRPKGVLVMNSFGELTPGKDFLTASLHRTLKTVFPTAQMHTSGNGNVFFVATAAKELKPYRAIDYGQIPFSLQEEVRVAAVPSTPPAPDHGMVLTDDYNPADYYDAENREELRRRLALSFRPGEASL